MAQTRELELGTHTELPIEDYHYRTGGISPTGAKAILRSPRDYWLRFRSPQRDQFIKPDTPALKNGKIIHAMLLEPHLVRSLVAVAPQVDRRTKTGKQEWAAFMETCPPDALVVREDEYLRLQDCADRIHESEVWKQLVEPYRAVVRAETTFVSELDDVAVKVRPDLIVEPKPDEALIIDLKSASDPMPEPFQRAAYSLGYHISAAMNVDVLASLGVRAEYVFLTFNLDPDYPTVIGYSASAAFLDFGRIEYREALATLRLCERYDEWPLPNQQIDPETGKVGTYLIDLDPPPYAKTASGQPYRPNH